MNGVPILLGEVANVQLGPDMRRGIAELNGEGEIFLRPIQSNLVKSVRNINTNTKITNPLTFKKQIIEKARYL